jgi:hypothetical protein
VCRFIRRDEEDIMRKLLLATTAAIAATLGGAGIAQAQVTTIPTLVPGTSPFSSATPAPGTVIVRLGGKVVAFAGALSDNGDKVTVPASTTATGGTASGSTAVPAGTYKQANYYIGEDFYLYPSVDGVAANGLQYGAFIEIRAENYNPAGGGGIVNTSGGSSISASDRTESLYIRRGYAYLGTPQVGTFRFGTTDGPTGLFETGTFEGFNDGGWNGNVPNAFSSNSSPSAYWPFAGGTGAEYATSKIVYLSPQFYGFNFGVSYEPNDSGANGYDGGQSLGLNGTGTGLANSGGCGYAEPGCDRLSSSPLASQAGRRQNTGEFDGRYLGTFGAVGVALEAGWMGSAHIHQTSTATTALGALNAVPERYNGFDIGQFGTTVTVGGLSGGGHIMYGDYVSSFGLKPVGAVPAFSWIGGTQYTFGPAVVGASYFHVNDAGSSGPLGTASPTVGQRRVRGVAAGGTYTMAPGVAVFLSYLWGDVKENGVNLLGDGEAATTHNLVTTQGLFVGTFVRW